MEKFALGMVVGGAVGALLVANNYKMRALVKKAQEEAQSKFNEILDEKIGDADKATDEKTGDAEKNGETAKSTKKPTKKAKKSATA